MKCINIVSLLGFYLTILCIGYGSVYAQKLQWVKQLGSNGWDKGISIAADKDGNVYTAGHFLDSIDFDPGTGVYPLISAGSENIFITKLDASGNFVWAKQIATSDWVACNAMTLDEKGNIYLVGSFLGTVDFDPSANVHHESSTDDIHTFILKLNSDGALVWVKQLGGILSINTYAITIDQQGNVYTIGYFDATVDFDPGQGVYYMSALGYSDIFVSKLDSTGNFVWAKQMSGDMGEVGYAIVVDHDQNIYTTGTFTATVDFDPGIGTFTLQVNDPTDADIFLCKLDAQGDFLWAKQLGGMEAHTIAIDYTGNILLAGIGYNSWNSVSIFKIDPLGNSLWTQEIPAYTCWALAVDSLSHLYLTGQYSGNKDFDPGLDSFTLTSTGNTDSYILKLDANGDFVWAISLGGTEQVWSQSIAVAPHDKVYTTGYFDGTADFDPDTAIVSLTSTGSYDVFIQKLESNILGMRVVPIENKISVFPNPTEGQVRIKLGNSHHFDKLLLSNLLGEIIWEKKILYTDSYLDLDIQGLTGMYFLTLQDATGNRAVTKVWKQ